MEVVFGVFSQSTTLELSFSISLRHVSISVSVEVECWVLSSKFENR